MLTKKERLKLDREHEGLMKNLAGIKNMNGMPDMMFVIDVRKEDIAIKEANRLNIPIVAVVDTNCSPEGINLVIPGNDDALRAIRLFASRIADAIIEGRQVGTEGVSTAAPAEGTEETAAEPIVESRIAIPKEYLTEDEVAEIESADIPDEEEDEDVEGAAAEAGQTADVVAADVVVADQTWETAEETHTDPEGGSYAHVEPGASGEQIETRSMTEVAGSKDMEEASEAGTEETNEATAS
jgi:small subunit ribosomal protein S2